MALGTLGSTLNDELNRLANGGTYRDMNQMVDEALAAKQWANRENINPYSTDTVGILNEIAGLGLDKRNWLDFNGVCNYIAGTTGLPAAAALRQVYNTTDLLTGVASYYVDATAPTNWGSLGYVYLNGLASNYISIPDATNLRITGDIDLRAYIALDDWTPATTQRIISKYDTTDNQRGYSLFVTATTGTVGLNWSTAGTSAIQVVSTAAPTIADGQPLWIRATLDVDNGAGGNTATFFTSTNGTTWTQLGDPVVTAGTTSIFAATKPVELGSRNIGNADLMTGKVYRAQVLNGIGGTTVLDVNIATDYKANNLDTFTATTGQFVTVVGAAANTVVNSGAAGSLLPTTLGSITAADSNDPKFLDHTGTNYVYLPGVSGNYLSVPDAAALDITGDIDLRAQIALDDWTPATTNGQTLIAKRQSASQVSYQFRVQDSTGLLQFIYSTDGTNTTAVNSSVAPTVTDGSTLWVRVTFDTDNGSSGNDTKFYTSTDGTTWTQLGTTRTNAGTVTMFSGTSIVEIGSALAGTATQVAGKIFRAQIFSDITGTNKVLDVDSSVITAGSATSFTALTGQTVTINRSTSGRKTVAVTQPTWLFGTDDYMEVNNRYMSSGTYLYLPGVASNYASAPDSAALDITGDIDIRVKVAMDDWTPSAETPLLSKWSTAFQRSYQLVLTTAGNLYVSISADGQAGSAYTATSTVATGITDGSTKWVRVTVDVDNGASGKDVKFFTSDDGSSWTQLGTTITTAGTTSLYAGTSPLEIGTNTSGTGTPARGKFFRAQVLNGINGTVAFDANFETSITSLLQTSFTESSANAATVTINRSGSTYRSAGITAAGYLYPGATNTFTASATSFLDFDASTSGTVIAINRMWNTPTSFGRIIDKRWATDFGWSVNSNGTAIQPRFSTSSSSSTISSTATGTTTAGTLMTISSLLDRANNNQTIYINTIKGDNQIPKTNLVNQSTLGIGSSPGFGSPQDMELYAAAVFRQALTASQIRQIVNYFANREVYL